MTILFPCPFALPAWVTCCKCGKNFLAAEENFIIGDSETSDEYVCDHCLEVGIQHTTEVQEAPLDYRRLPQRDEMGYDPFYDPSRE